MVSTTIFIKIVLLMLVSAEVMFSPIFGAKILFIPSNFNPRAAVHQGIRKWREFQLHDVPGRRRGTLRQLAKHVCG